MVCVCVCTHEGGAHAASGLTAAVDNKHFEKNKKNRKTQKCTVGVTDRERLMGGGDGEGWNVPGQ